MYTFTYLTLFTFKLEPTEVQDAVKNPNFEFYRHLRTHSSEQTHTKISLRKLFRCV